MPSHLDAVVSLQTTLDALESAQHRLNNIPDWMQELHQEHSEKQQEIDRVAEASAEADKERREAEATFNDSQEKLKHYQEQISLVSTQREYGALLKEIDTVKEQIESAEQASLEAFERNESAQKELEVLKESFQDLDQRYHAELAKWEAQKPEIASEAKSLESKVEALRADLPKGVIRQFERIRDRLEGSAVSPIMIAVAVRGANIMWHCGACNYNVRPQVVVEIKRNGSINQCESCKRLLYCPPEPEEES